jgi:hypothetical protein
MRSLGLSGMERIPLEDQEEEYIAPSDCQEEGGAAKFNSGLVGARRTKKFKCKTQAKKRTWGTSRDFVWWTGLNRYNSERYVRHNLTANLDWMGVYRAIAA